jgi:hypothetical protein
LSTEPHPIKVVDTAASNNMRADEIVINTTETGKVTAVHAVMSIFCKKKCNLQSANSGNKKLSCKKAESADFLEGNSQESRNLSQKSRKCRLSKKLAPMLKKLELNSTNLRLKSKKPHPDCTKKPDLSISYGLKVKNKTIRVLLDSRLSGHLLFMNKRYSRRIFVATWALSPGAHPMAPSS